MYATAHWNYAAKCATDDGFEPGSHAWLERIKELLPIIAED